MVVSRSCTVQGCNKAVFAKGYCPIHYSNFHSSYGTTSSTVDGVDDMVLLTKLSNNEIVKNLKRRHKNDVIYTYIGSVVVVVNPYKNIPLYTNDHIKRYCFSHQNDLPPHIFSLAEQTYRQLLNEEESQCVIISGESGAGKTEASKQVMQYISAVSGSGQGVEQIKNIILESNPLLEAFGNAKTLRNNNSSRFGKYFEIKFSSHGSPIGGFITNYLLEKSRVVYQAEGERGFHIMYQLIAGAPRKAKESFQLTKPQDFHYLNQSSCIYIEDVNDKQDFSETRHAMKVVGIRGREQEEIFRIISCVLHLGNIKFVSSGHKNVDSVDAKNVKVCSKLLGVDENELIQSLTYRHIRTGTREEYDVPNNYHQAVYTRDAIAKTIYDRLFSWLVRRINSAMVNENANDALVISVLDIYGFEVFQKNGFEQFCINYVNEKLQQIFIELTLKAEQEEYVQEHIQWTPIKFFNNRIVCELIEGNRPPGIFRILDDVCATMHSQKSGTERTLLSKLSGLHSSHPHFIGSSKSFIIKHFAGDVTYNPGDFAEKNADTLNKDCLQVLKTSNSKLIQVLFPEEIDYDSKKRPTTASFKIRNACGKLVDALMACSPHYVRCVKSNDNKKANQFDDQRVQHQIKYLGLLENIKVRRAGFAYRQEYYKFVNRFSILCKKLRSFNGSDQKAAEKIIHSVRKTLKLTKADVQMGKTKIFIKQPETVFALEDLKRKVIDNFARVIQHAWLKYIKTRDQVKLRLAVAKFFEKRGKERRRESFYRPFLGDYLNATANKEIMDILTLYGDSSILFSDRVDYINNDESLQLQHRLLIIAPSAMYILKRLEGHIHEYFLLRHIPLKLLQSVSLSTYADNFIVLHVKEWNKSDRMDELSEWMPDKASTKCLRCDIPFTLFNRRHHCRLCSRLFCNNCSSKSQIMPDFDFHAPVRVCDDCFGKESIEYLHDQTIKSDKKTEIVAILRDLFKRLLKKDLQITFSKRVRVQIKPTNTQLVTKELYFKRHHNSTNESVKIVNSNSVEILAPPGLPKDFVEKRRRAAAERAKRFEAKRRAEQQQRREAERLRQEEREQERKRRIEEKKRRKKLEREKKRQEEEEKRARSQTSTSRFKRPVQSNREDRSQTINAKSCNNCGCSDFRPNAFKPKNCVNCFHEH